MDPLICVQRFNDPLQIEVVGLLASCLAYGRVERIIHSIDTILKIADNNLYAFICTTSFSSKKQKLVVNPDQVTFKIVSIDETTYYMVHLEN